VGKPMAWKFCSRHTQQRNPIHLLGDGNTLRLSLVKICAKQPHLLNLATLITHYPPMLAPPRHIQLFPPLSAASCNPICGLHTSHRHCEPPALHHGWRHQGSPRPCSHMLPPMACTHPYTIRSLRHCGPSTPPLMHSLFDCHRLNTVGR
jgi:hypothetical protein